MSYIGRGTDAISNVEKLDNITFNGGTTYALTKSSAAFTPVGANNILISIDGVIQQGNFSVSTTNIVFDFSPTSSNTCDFILHYGTGVLNVPADGSISAAKMAANSVDSASYVDGSIDNAHIADDQIDSEHYAAGSIDLEHMSSESVDEDNLHISNAGSNGQYLQKQSGNSGGLTWATVSTSASAHEIVACKSVVINPSGGVSTTSSTYAEADSGLRITHAMADSSNKLIFWFHSPDAYISSGCKGAVGVAKTTDVTTNVISRRLSYVKSESVGVEPHNLNGFAEYSPGATTEFIYTLIHRKISGTGTFYTNNTTSTGSIRFCLMEVQQ